MSAPNQNTAQARDAGSPFTAHDADIILRSVDGVNYRTYRNYLTRTLHGFDEILQDGQLHGLGSAEEVQDGLPVITLPESSAVLGLFLRTLFPAELGCPRLSDNLDHLADVIKALSKYIVKNFPFSVYNALSAAAVKEPERVYAITCRYNSFSEITKAAAKSTLLNPRRLDNLPMTAVAEMSGPQYHALTMYQMDCRSAAMMACATNHIQTAMNDMPGIDINVQCHCQQLPDPVYLDYIPAPGDDPNDFGASACMIPFWIGQYLDNIRDELAKSTRICGAVALNKTHLATAIYASRGCPVCSNDVVRFLGFAHDLVRWIDEAIAKVEFKGNAPVD